MITRLGEVSLSDVCPLLKEALVALDGAQAFAIPELQAKIFGLGNVLAAITIAPPAIGATITAALATVASLQATITVPGITVEASAIASLLASLNLQLQALTVSISAPSANVSAYVFDGDSSVIGSELQAAITGDLPGAPGQAYALILATTSRPAWISLGSVLKVSL